MKDSNEKVLIGKVKADWLNVRNGIDVESGVVGILEKDSRVELLGRINGWFTIAYGLGVGYINGKFIEVLG